MIKIVVATVLPLYLFSYSIDFETALEKTIHNNKGLKAKKLEIEKSKYDLEEVKGYDFGSLVLSENISKTNHAGYVFGMKLASREATFGDFGFNEFDMSGATNPLPVAPKDLNHPQTRTNYETKINYSVPLFTGFKLQSAKKMAKLQILAQNAKYNYDEKALGLEVLKAYNGAVASKEFIKATQKAKKATSSFVEFANALYNEGLVTSIDVKQAKVYDMGVDSQMIEAQNRYDLALSYLRFLTSDETISDVKDFKNISHDISSVQILQEEAHEKREDFAWMRYNTQTMQSKVNYESANKYPTVGAQVEYGYNDDEFSTLDINEKDYYMGAIGISYAIFDGSITSSKAQKAKIEYKKTQHYFDYMKDGIKLEVEKNILTLQAKEKILKQKIKAQNLSDEVLEQSSAMYKNHLINMSDLLMQQANQQKANAQTIMAKYEKSLAAATLQISLGKGIQ